MSRASWLLALVALAVAAPCGRAQTAGEPPLNITADNMSGSHGPEGDFVMLNGNVHITRGRTVLTADSGRYYKAQGMLYLDGRVTMVDSLTTLTCDHASYSENEDRLYVQGNVKIVDKDAVLQAPSGIYDRRTGRADLAGPVQGRDRRLRLVSDRAVYLRDSALVQARDHVHGVDEEHKTEIDADSVDYDRNTKVAVATGHPVMRAKSDDGRVIELRARRLVVDTEKRLAEAIDSVRVARDTLQASGTHALFDDVAQQGWLTGHPRAWDDQTTVTGDTLEFLTEKRAIKEVVVRPNAVMDYLGSRPGSVGEKSRLTGDTVSVFFTHHDIDSLVAVGSAHDEYSGAARAGKTAERNDASGDTITVFFRERKIDRAQARGHALGVYRIAVAVGDTAAAKKEVVKYDAKRIEFRVPESTIMLDQAAHLVYQDLELNAGQVRYDIERQTLVAEGKPILADRGEEVNGQLMSYDLGTRIGTIYSAETSYEKGLYHGERIRKVGEDELDVMNGSYSTCNLPKPHYHFSSHWMKIYLKDKLVAKPVVFYIENVPLLALPFWVFPVKPGRHSGFLFPQFEFGLNNQAGQFIRNAGYYWAPNDYMDLTASGDYYQADPSWVLRGEGNYKLLYLLEGSFNGSYARDESPLNRSENWDFSASHNQEISPRTRLTAQGNFVSSKNYNSSDLFGRPLSQRLNRFLTSSVALSHNADWASINVVVDRRQDLDADQNLIDANSTVQQPLGTVASLPNLTSTNPSVSVSFPTRALGSLGLLKNTPLKNALRTLYFGLNSQFLSYSERRGFVAGHIPFAADSSRDSITALGESSTTRRALSNSLSLSDSRHAFGWINIQPSVRANVVVFDHDQLGHQIVPASVWSSSVTMSSTFYGTFRPRVLGIDGLRHVVSPSLSMSYSPEFKGLTYVDTAGVRQNRFLGFSGIGISGFEQSFLNFGLDQRLQAKLKHGENVTRLDNLLSWSLGGSYDFLYRQHGLPHPLSLLSSTVLLQPPNYANASLSWSTDVYNPRPLRALSYNLGLNLASGGQRRNTPDLPLDQKATSESNENWSLGLAYSYSGAYATDVFGGTSWASQRTANAVARYQLSPSWSLEYSASLDLTLNSIQTQQFQLTRDLHCWQAIFTRTFIVGGETEYYFRLQVKDQKEIYVERGTRVGSLGGIQ